MKTLAMLSGMILAALSTGQAFAAEEEAARDRLVKVIEGTRDLMKNAQESSLANQVEPRLSDDRKQLPARRFPTRGDVRRYAEQRPWVQQYLLRLSSHRRAAGPKDPGWPQAGDAPALRKLLVDAEPAVRGLAAEALATLHEPNDIPRIAKLLDDQTESIHALGWNMILTARMIMPAELGGEGDDALDIERSWQPRRVYAYAKAALKLMTGQDLDARNFEKWWERNKGGQTCVWYWQERLHRDLAAAQAMPFQPWRQANADETHEAWWKRCQEQLRLRFDAVRRAVAKELETLPAEVEVKVRLLAVNRCSTALGVSLDEPLMGPFECRRVPGERLLELLERKGLWDDVDWDVGAYNTLVVQLAGRAEEFFERKHVHRLRAVQKRESQLWWNGHAALYSGISRLLPPAQDGKLDDPETRDGVLREGVRRLSDVFARGSVARELVRVGLPRNCEFLETEFFAERSRAAIPDLRGAVLQELGTAPLTQEKRKELVRLLLDKRFEPLWTEPRGAMGADQHRRYAIRALNAHAGRELLSDQYDQRLADPLQAGKTLVEVARIVRDALAGP